VQEPTQPSQKWQEKVLDKVLFASIKEQRARRRWGIFFKTIFFLYLVALLAIFLPKDFRSKTAIKEHVAVIKIDGVIDSQAVANADDINKALRKAFESQHAEAVILQLNSPGGSPVQAGEIYDEILRLRQKYPRKPIYGVISDACASGCYYVAAATDEIYANEASMVGSIGVMFNGFGFVDLLQKVGVERRLYTAGVNKGFLDPFEPVKPEDEDFMKDLLDVVHMQFIAKIKLRRESKLSQDTELFSGLVWTGQQAIPLGLVDGLGSVRYVAREIVGQEELIDYSPSRGLSDLLSGRFGTQAKAEYLMRLISPSHGLQ
jgi:protease-4